ncbi:MAG TPA: GNVR domain-containing protein [Candidatus Omnitrophota bacterium]|nr:GNVR domain-containing protein [Candidatus Omnitrophota bacterium]
MTDIEQESSVNPMNYLKIFFRRKELVIIPAFIGLILGICTGIILPKKYLSSTILLVEEGKTDNPLFQELAVSSTVSQRMNSIRESMLGWYSMLKLVERLDLAKDVKTQQEFENLILGIRKDILIKLRTNNIIELAYVGENPTITRDVVKTITEIFIERNVETQNQETSDAIAFIEEQLKLYRSKVKSAEIANLKDRLKVLLIDSTENHPTVKELQSQIKTREDELKKENLQYIEDAQLTAGTVNPMIDQIRNALDNIDGGRTIKTSGDSSQQDYLKLLIAEKLDDVMARDASVNDKIYAMLLSRLETAKITQRLQTSKEGTKYTILDPPRVPLRPFQPNKVLVALIGLFIGILCGTGFILAIEFMDQSFIDVEDANRFFKEPLLGAISKIQTELGLKKEKERVSWMYSMAFITGMAVIVITLAVAHYLKV